MHRDFMTTGPMAGLGFTHWEMRRYNFTDQELRDHFSPTIGAELGIRRDQLIAERVVWRTTKRIFIAIIFLTLALISWIVATDDELRL